ncbi:hypothetical protein AVEN_106733-1 [Araneus ventricosus]|uniref:Uncharacterized protein n=1 Tax=Araneus ventricosus TaxID=182803 RepID=A0A4Y2NQ81_ARAVE|nr:hypothetical protein AVEN_106733-1 [Araneus ventricosus]
MPVLGAEPGQEGRLWATSRVPVDGAAIASDVRESSCREQETRTRYETHERHGLSFLTKTKDDDEPSKSLLMKNCFNVHIFNSK